MRGCHASREKAKAEDSLPYAGMCMAHTSIEMYAYLGLLQRLYQSREKKERMCCFVYFFCVLSWRRRLREITVKPLAVVLFPRVEPLTLLLSLILIFWPMANESLSFNFPTIAEVIARSYSNFYDRRDWLTLFTHHK